MSSPVASVRRNDETAGSRPVDPSGRPPDPHPTCIVCGRENARGFHLDFRPRDDGGVESRFQCGAAFEGYPHELHGGVIAMLLDGAMTNCLFRHGHVAVTGHLEIRYRHPVSVDRAATVRAWIDHSRPPFRRATAELVQDRQVKATAAAKFFDRPAPC